MDLSPNTGDMNTKLHTVTDAEGRPTCFFMSIGHVSDYTGAAGLPSSLPRADWPGKKQQDNRIKACISGVKSRKETMRYDKRRYEGRNRIEIIFGRLKDRQRVATRYDRCPQTCLSAFASAATILSRL